MICGKPRKKFRKRRNRPQEFLPRHSLKRRARRRTLDLGHPLPGDSEYATRNTHHNFIFHSEQSFPNNRNLIACTLASSRSMSSWSISSSLDSCSSAALDDLNSNRSRASASRSRWISVHSLSESSRPTAVKSSQVIRHYHLVQQSHVQHLPRRRAQFVQLRFYAMHFLRRFLALHHFAQRSFIHLTLKNRRTLQTVQATPHSFCTRSFASA